MSAYFQYQVSDKNTIENIKLKIGRPDVSKIDRAIYSAEKLENETFYAGAVANTELIEVEDIENPQNIIDHYFDIYEDFLENPNKTTPGSHCLSKCGRPAVCGEFPVIGDEKINTRYRAITVSKTNIRDLERCERKASWNFQYSIPRDKEDSFSGDFGITFHKVAQTMLVNNNNRNDEGEKERLASLIENEDEDTQKKIFKKYEELLEKLKGYENLDITLSEYPVGFTPITQGLIANKDLTVKEGRVATSFIGKADLLGRLDGVPIVIELKTGKKHPGDLTEAELYALGVSKRLKAKEVIVLHIYVNEDKDEANERRFGEDEFISIEKKFESFAEKIASWNPNDALSPSYEVGDWCNYCEFQETCAEFR
jgi:CRISPR/Cas system-associated exonuclease Cas4 (RecB family)